MLGSTGLIALPVHHAAIAECLRIEVAADQPQGGRVEPGDGQVLFMDAGDHG